MWKQAACNLPKNPKNWRQIFKNMEFFILCDDQADAVCSVVDWAEITLSSHGQHFRVTNIGPAESKNDVGILARTLDWEPMSG